MRIVIVTGMSGAGKRTALKVFEDADYYCVDNLPVELIPKFVELAMTSKSKIENIAMGIDVRSGDSFPNLERILDELDEKDCKYDILFLEAEDDVLVKRYKETRRNHPLAGDNALWKVLQWNARKLHFLKSARIILLIPPLF